MSQTTTISWCDSTFNPWIGCAKVSPGCANCYAEKSTPARTLGVLWGDSRLRTRQDTYWKEPIKWNKRLTCDCGTVHIDPLDTQTSSCPVCQSGYRKPRVFCGSLCDWLDDQVPIEWLADLLDLIRLTPNLDWLLLTKRPGNWNNRIRAVHNEWMCGSPESVWLARWLGSKSLLFDPAPPPNVWIGVSAEDQERWDERVPALLGIPAAKRFVSCEPMLGPVSLYQTGSILSKGLKGLDWVIFGGESGSKARPCNVQWIRDGVTQCQAVGIACFVKQIGSHTYEQSRANYAALGDAPMLHPKGGDPDEWPQDLRIQQFP